MTRPFSQLISALALTWARSSPAPIAAQTPADDAANTAWQLDAMIHLQRMRAFRDLDTGTQPTPSTIPERAMDADPSGIISTYQPSTIPSDKIRQARNLPQTSSTFSKPGTAFPARVASTK